MDETTSVKSRWSFETKCQNSHRLIFDNVKTGWEQWALLMTDEHIDSKDCNRELLTRHHEEAMERNAPIFKFGDLMDLMQGKWDKRADFKQMRPEHIGNNYLDLVLNTTAEYYAPYAENIVLMTPGNHECFSSDTELLTSAGWKSVKEIEMSDVLATVHPFYETVQWCLPERVLQYDAPQEMHHWVGRGYDFLVTPNHCVMKYPQQRAGVERSDLTWNFSTDLISEKGGRVALPVSARSGNVELRHVHGKFLKDEEIRMVAWVLTDGHISGKGKEGTYRSVGVSQRTSKSHLITSLLDALEWEYTCRERNRPVEAIMGTALKTLNKPSVEIELLAGLGKDRLLRLLPSKSRIPSWVQNLSDRQFQVFLESVVDGDGSRHKSSPETSWMVYGKKPFVDELQGLCVTHSYRAGVAEYRPGAFRLDINPTNVRTVASSKKSVKLVSGEGKVHCVTVPNGTVFARRNGFVVISGNSSITQRHGTQMMPRLQEGIKYRSKNGVAPALGAYSGFVSFVFKFGEDKGGIRPSQQRVVLHYHHGYGGGGEVTRGMIDNNRTRGQYLADIYIMGHIHRRNEDENVLIHLDQNGNVVQKVQNFLRAATYKNEGMHGDDWHVMQGRSGRPQGGWWIRFFTVRRNGVLCVDWDCIKAK